MKPGDIVAPKKGSYFHKRGHRWTGKVIDIQTWEETGALTAENHGSINIELLTVENYYLEVGEEESYSYFGWEVELEVISEAR